MKTPKVTIPIMAVSVVAATILTITPVLAADEEVVQPKENFFIGLFHKIVNKFKFNFKVEKNGENSFGDLKNPSGTPMAKPSGAQEQQLTDEERLTKLVEEGIITEAQKTAILAELATLKSTYGQDVLKDLTEEERQEKLKEMQETMIAWAKAQEIDIQYMLAQPQNGMGQGQPGDMGQGSLDNQQGRQPPAGQQNMKRPAGTPKPTPTPTS